LRLNIEWAEGGASECISSESPFGETFYDIHAERSIGREPDPRYGVRRCLLCEQTGHSVVASQGTSTVIGVGTCALHHADQFEGECIVI